MTTIRKLALTTLVFAAATACSTDPQRAESDYGQSVQQMINGQLADPQAARNPSTDLPGGLDGDKGDQAIEAYRAPPPAGSAAPSTVNVFRIRR